MAKQKTLCPECRDAYLMSLHLPDGGIHVKCEADCGFSGNVPADHANQMREAVKRHVAHMVN